MRGPVRQFSVRYGTAFWDYVLEPGEQTLSVLYELGRQAVAAHMSTLDLAAVHHDVLGAALTQCADAAEVAHLVQAGRDTFVETLSAYEMVARGFHEVREDALVERRQAALVRRLSTFLADTSLTVEGDESLAEMLHLVAEHARELLAASRCEASLVAGAGDVTAVAVAGSPSPGGGPGAAEQRMQADLETLAGRRLGRLEVVRVEGPAFSDADCAVLMHIAQMTSGAVERSLPYHRRTASRAGR